MLPIIPTRRWVWRCGLAPMYWQASHPLARAAGETAPLLFTALGNDRFEVGRLVQGGIRGGQSFFSIIGNILEQPVDSLPLTLYKYTQQPFPERINQSWAVALVLISLVLVTNIGARLWVHARSSGK